jgi:hypothetical protein
VSSWIDHETGEPGEESPHLEDWLNLYWSFTICLKYKVFFDNALNTNQGSDLLTKVTSTKPKNTRIDSWQTVNQDPSFSTLYIWIGTTYLHNKYRD